ncbi:hypothetical protein POTOM_051859 [Populus tomentosa]|uniref:Sphingomyelin synthase-like domain-containing protein n=1 Tax=Populus tomentosa TaxID=118781 RepID=A0A8X7Y6W1_POPTO|nr:hypothetical protein POTOM_051859 [Populus tomentosa]
MTLYIGREASKFDAYVLTSVLYVSCPQYIHGLAARGVHYLHRPGPTLQDVGFFLLPEFGQDKSYISETLFTFVFLSFIVWTFHPFIFKSKKIYTVLIWCRVLAFLVVSANLSLCVSFPCVEQLVCPDMMYNRIMLGQFASQFLRIITFYSTQLPGPNYHCREGSKLARLPHPESVFEVLLINCRCIKQLGWLIAVVQSFLIIASRKHYTVDVTVAWYTVNLVVFFLDKKLPGKGVLQSSVLIFLYTFSFGRTMSSMRDHTDFKLLNAELPDRTGGASFLLPLSTRDKDSKTKEENHKLLNGNSVDPPDWRQRTQVNGKILDDANLVHADATAMNGA